MGATANGQSALTVAVDQVGADFTELLPDGLRELESRQQGAGFGDEAVSLGP